MSSSSSGDGIDAVMEPVDSKPGEKGDHPVDTIEGKAVPEPLPVVLEAEEPAVTPTTDVDLPSVDEKSEEAAAAAPAAASVRTEPVSLKVIYNKKKYDVDFFLDETIANLKTHLESVISVPAAMQKIMVKGLAKDDKTLRELGISPTSKVLVVGSTFSDVLAVSQPAPKKGAVSEEKSTSSSKEPLSEQKMHKKVVSAGPPDDVVPGIKNAKDPLPDMPLSGLVNKQGGKLRLTFKLELDQIWFGTKERTEKVNMSSIKTIVSEPIVGREEYHIMGFQLGTTEASRYWVYWVPAQFVDAIKDTVLGNFQYF